MLDKEDLRGLRVLASHRNIRCDLSEPSKCTDAKWKGFVMSRSCPGGTQSHNRVIATSVKGEGKNCTGPSSEEKPCNEGKHLGCDCDHFIVLIAWLLQKS